MGKRRHSTRKRSVIRTDIFANHLISERIDPRQHMIPQKVALGTKRLRRILIASVSIRLINALAHARHIIHHRILNYGRNGRKLLFAGDYDKYDEYEASRDVLDLQISARFLKERLEIKFNASDLLNQDVIAYRNCGYEIGDPNNDKSYADLTSDMNYNSGDWVLSRIKKGINLSLSIRYKF